MPVRVDWTQGKLSPVQECTSTAGVLADENAAHCWWFGNGFQSLGVGAGSFLRSLAVGETAGPLEDGVVGGADFVEEAQGRSVQPTCIPSL
jgi:hypothetical protein